MQDVRFFESRWLMNRPTIILFCYNVAECNYYSCELDYVPIKNGYSIKPEEAFFDDLKILKKHFGDKQPDEIKKRVLELEKELKAIKEKIT